MPAPARPTDALLVEGLCRRLGLDALDPVEGLAALTHKSFINEHRDEGADNERLEFLGDAVVDLAVSHRLMERFPSADEGELSKLRALLVNEESLARVARQLGLGLTNASQLSGNAGTFGSITETVSPRFTPCFTRAEANARARA